MPERLLASFDLQAHRGGAGLFPENTMPAFENAVRLGVGTLECDLTVSSDGVGMITHDPLVNVGKCRDTGPVHAHDPLFPYVGKPVSRLTAAQLDTLDLGALPQRDHPRQQQVPGTRMPRLTELLAWVAAEAPHVRLNIETKYSPVTPSETPRAHFVDVFLDAVRAAGLVERVSLQSFDWALLALIRKAEPRIRRNALTSPHYQQPGVPGPSPWLGGLDIDDFGGDVVAAAKAAEVDAISPIHGSPVTSGPDDPAYRAYTTAAMIAEAHGAGIAVLPYTVDDPAEMRTLIAAGVDGFITNVPDTALEVLGGVDTGS